MREQDSPAIQLLQMVWNHAQRATSHSWLKLNHAMRDTLSLAIKSGMRFDLEDFSVISERFRSGYWIGADPEWIYRLAVLYRHSSAYQAYEKSCDRKPFIFKGARIHTHTGDGPCGEGLARLIVGAQFQWKGEKITVTSFNDAAKTFTACSYIVTGEREYCPTCKRNTKWGTEKVLHRYTINHADLKAAKAEAKVAS